MTNIFSPKVTIILLNYNGWKDTLECLDSLFRIKYPNWELFLVDNGSHDDSILKFNEWAKGKICCKTPPMIPLNLLKLPKCVEELVLDDKTNQIKNLKKCSQLKSFETMKLLKINQNHGFTGGNNIALEYIINNTDTDFMLLLNNDVVVDPDFLDELVKVAENSPEIGILGPTVYYYHDPKRIQSGGVEINWKKGEQIIHHQNEVDTEFNSEVVNADYVIGCAILARKEVFQNIGLLKWKYFTYWEDAEWCIRAKKEGYDVCYVPKAKLWHKEAATTNKISSFLFEYYNIRNKLWFLREHASPKDLNNFLLYFFFYDIFHLGAFLLMRNHDIRFIPHYIKGVWDGLFTNYDD